MQTWACGGVILGTLRVCFVTVGPALCIVAAVSSRRKRSAAGTTCIGSLVLRGGTPS